MRYTTHNHGKVDTNFTYLIGRLVASYDELVAIFGEPLPGDQSKVDAEWQIQFSDCTVVTIYNWKNGRAYMGPAGLPKEMIGVWNVGAKSQRAYDMLSLVILAKRKVIESST